ncbi:LIM zinc-binding domain-containing Nebulette [Crotalus adamanteus]|uniref:LIM zinc-binding domain-containing Nebulette n=1 Tax=Crotalus adamanteus TaxID=8729 RepID=A0AAW1B2D9_CROAD
MLQLFNTAAQAKLTRPFGLRHFFELRQVAAAILVAANKPWLSEKLLFEWEGSSWAVFPTRCLYFPPEHYPKQSFTTVADTPENIRLKQQSELQSQVKYKRDFEESKGRGFSIVTDTPELQRLKRTQEQISNVCDKDHA